MIFKTLIETSKGNIRVSVGDGCVLLVRERGGPEYRTSLKWCRPSQIEQLVKAGCPGISPRMSIFWSAPK